MRASGYLVFGGPKPAMWASNCSQAMSMQHADLKCDVTVNMTVTFAGMTVSQS
jgi:hypothetical protein